MIHNQLRYLVISNFVPQNEYSTKIDSSLVIEEFFDYYNLTNVINTDIDDFKAQFVFSARL